MEDNNLDFEKLYSLISKFSENGKVINDIDSMEYTEFATVEEVPSTENKTIKEYLDSEMGSHKEVETKKLMALASVMSGDDRSAIQIAADVDAGVTATKVAYKVGTGELDVLEATDIIIDKSATKLNAFLQHTLNAEVIGEVAGEAVALVFPPAQFVKPYVKAVVKRCVPVVKTAISYGIKSLATKAKSVVRSGANWVTRKVKKLANSWV